MGKIGMFDVIRSDPMQDAHAMPSHADIQNQSIHPVAAAKIEKTNSRSQPAGNAALHHASRCVRILQQKKMRVGVGVGIGM